MPETGHREDGGGTTDKKDTGSTGADMAGGTANGAA